MACTRVVIKARSSDWHACIDGDSRLWEAEPKLDAAIRAIKRRCKSEGLPDDVIVQYAHDDLTTRRLGLPEWRF